MDVFGVVAAVAGAEARAERSCATRRKFWEMLL